MSAAASRDFVIEVVRKLAGQEGSQVLPRRWVVERTFGWMTRGRRLIRGGQRRHGISEAMIHIGMDAPPSGASPIHDHSQTGPNLLSTSKWRT